MAISGKKVMIKIQTTDSTPVGLIDGACINSIGDLDMSADTIDVTCHGPNNVRKKIKGLIDLGTLPVTIEYEDHTMASALYTAFVSDVSYDVVISIPTVTPEQLTFSAIVTGLSQTHAKEDAMQQTVTLTLDGRTVPTWVTAPAITDGMNLNTEGTNTPEEPTDE